MLGHLLVLDETLEHVELLENSGPVIEHGIVTLCSHCFKRLEGIIGTVLVKQPSRRLWQKRDANGENQRRETLNGQGKPPLGTRGVDKIESEANPAGNRVADAEHDAVDADEEAADARRRDFGLVEGDEDDDGAYSQASDEAKDEIHGDAHAAGLQRAPNQRHNGRDEDGALSTKHISRFHAREAADEATGLEEAIDGADELRGVGAGVEVEVGDEGRLAESRGDDAGAVAVGHAAEGNEADDQHAVQRRRKHDEGIPTYTGR